METVMKEVAERRRQAFAREMRQLAMLAYAGEVTAVRGQRANLPIDQLAEELHYQASTVEALLYGKRDLTAQGLSALLKLLRKKRAITGFDSAWEFVEVLRSAEHLAVVGKVFDPPPFVQMAPSPPALAVERAEEEDVWRELLEGAGPVVVWGMPGVGKSVLVRGVAHRPEVRWLFPDGVLWTSLEPDWQPGDWLDVWAKVLGVEEEKSAESRREAIIRRVGSGRYLVVVDDVWSEQSVGVLLQHGPYVRLLVTSPSAAVAQRIGGREIGLREMRAEEAVELLRRAVGDERFDEGFAEQVAQVVGRHCLALALVARLWLKHHPGDLPALLDDLTQEQNRLDTLAVGQAERLPAGVRPEDAARWRSGEAAFHAVYRHLSQEGQVALRVLGAVGARLPYVDGALMAALLGQADQMTAARNALRGLAEFGVVEPVDTGELAEQWAVMRLSPPEDDETLYRIPVLWRDFAERQLRGAGELGRVSRRLRRYGGKLRTPWWRCAVKPLPGTTRWGRWREVGEAVLFWKAGPRLTEMARQARLHGLLFDPRLRHLVYRVLERNQRLAGQAGAVGIGLILTAGMALLLAWSLVQTATLSVWAWLVLAATACFCVATPVVWWMFLVQWLEGWRLWRWLAEVLVPLSLAGPQERARRLAGLGLEDGDIWRAMVGD